MKRLLPIMLLSLIVSIPAYSQTFMTEEQMIATMVGATLSGIAIKDDRTPWTQTYHPHKKGKPKGKIDGAYGGDPYKSKWWVKKGKWCEDWGSGRGCWNLELVDDSTIQAYKDGKPLKNVWTIEKSN